MPRLTPLPEPLRYLQPFRKLAARLGPDEAVEDLDPSQLNKLLLERIRGIPVEEGKRKLQDDQAILDEWLSSPDLNDNGGMFFLKSYLMALPGLVDRYTSVSLLKKGARADESRFEQYFHTIRIVHS